MKDPGRLTLEEKVGQLFFLGFPGPEPDRETRELLDVIRPGGIVLSHDLHSQTVDAMPATLDGLLSRGYKFVTVSQLLAMKTEAPASAQAAVVPSNS